jgi:hypothetical protein
MVTTLGLPAIATRYGFELRDRSARIASASASRPPPIGAFKLCPRIVFDPDDARLIKGMYIPLEYWRRLEKDPSIEGPFEGRGVTFENAGRYLNNTSFADLVAGGWIGTTVQQTAILDPIIREILETGRTVTIAVKRDLTIQEQGARVAEAEEQELDEDESWGRT